MVDRQAGSVLVLAAVLAGTAARADVLYQSDLASRVNGAAKLPRWSLGGGQYRLEDGWLTVASERSNPYAVLEARHDGDGTFRATVRNARECHWSALLARGVYRLEVNNQFVALRLMRKAGDDWPIVGEAKSYALYAHSTQEFELRLSIVGRRVYGFLDDKLLIEYEDPNPAPAGGDYALMSGWGTDLAWRGISLSDEPDLSQWPVVGPLERAPRGLVEVTRVRSTSADAVYFDGEAAGLQIKLKNPGGEAAQLELEYRLLDIWQDVRAQKREAVRLDAGKERELTVEFEPPRRGCFKVALYAGREGEEPGWVEDLGSFTVVSKALYDAPRDEPSYFGGHMDGINHEWHFEAGRKIGIDWARCHDMLQHGWWTRIQPDGPDQWQWPYDGAQQVLDRLAFTTLGEFLWTPKWATSAADGAPGNPAAYPPKDWDAFARYVFETVSHYKGSIKHWEVWNEPHYAGFFRGTPEEYARVLQVAYREAKRADPECTVIGGGGVPVRRLEWVERMLEAGGAGHMDGFSIHYLEPDIARDRLPKLRRLLDGHGVKGPIWNTEENVPSTSFFDQIRADQMEPEARYHFRNACFELVRRYMENIANGVERVFHYDQADPWRFKTFPKVRTEGFEHGIISGSMWDECRMYRPIAAAHAALALAIGGKRFRSRHEVDGLQVFIFEGKDGATAVQYATFRDFGRREQVRLSLPEGVDADRLTVMDVMGNERRPEVEDGAITLLKAREPVYLTCEGPDAAEVLRRMYEEAAQR